MKHIFNYNNNKRVHVPVKFSRIIANVQHQLNIQRDSIVNITPYEVYLKIEETLEELNQYYNIHQRTLD